MLRSTVILGDELPVLQPLAARDEVTSAVSPGSDHHPPRSARAVVIGLDLQDSASVRDAKRHLREVVRRSLSAVRRYPALAHLFVIYVIPATVHPDRLSSLAGSVASRLHAALERETGQYVDVTLVDATACRDSALLADRLADRISEKAGLHTDIALEWADIRDRSIQRATLDQYT
ncbi:MAG TPA: hypothetical protein VNP97_02245 [Microbacterium sp.]|jgi:hypothetical protein|nr:hypothetical protein [Microbacterium sp.]